MNQPGTRFREVDILRGAALGGMLVANLGAFSGITPIAYLHGFDWLAAAASLLLVQGKFYPIFAFLFGWGIALRQLESGKDGSFAQSNLRRMAVLAGFGLLHGALLWQGDILLLYALFGAGLPFLHRVPTRAILAAAVSALLLGSLFDLPGLGQILTQTYAGLVDPVTKLLSGSLQSSAAASYLLKLVYWPHWAGNSIAAGLAGYLVGARRLDTGWLTGWKFGLLAGFGLVLNTIFVLASAFPGWFTFEWAGFLRDISVSLGGPLLGLAYYRAARVLSGGRLQKATALALEQIGRMPLTTYLAQTLIFITLQAIVRPFKPDAPQVWLLAAAVFTGQTLFAKVWLGHFRRGPLEAAWRNLSRDRRKPEQTPRSLPSSSIEGQQAH